VALRLINAFEQKLLGSLMAIGDLS